MSLTKLELQHIWQTKPELENLLDLPPRQRCGLACLEMVLHYHGIPELAATILSRARELKAINQAGDWWHPGEVNVLKNYGLIAWRRNWNLDHNQLDFLRVNEGYNEPQLNSIKWQIEAEKNYTEPNARFIHSLQTSILANAPVIASVKAEFSHNKHNHQVVVAGWDENKNTFFVYDPIMPTGPTEIHDSYLVEYSNLWAIFAEASKSLG